MNSSKEARIIRAKQMSGAAVSMALKPSRGLRDDIVFAGGKPKDHNKENYQRIKGIEKANKALQEEKSKPPPAPFKLKQFDNVQPKLSTRRNSAATTPASASDFGVTPDSTRPSSSASNLTGVSTTSSKKNFIQINAMKAKQGLYKRPATSTPDLSHSPGRQTPLGELPKYLVDRKVEWADREKERLFQLEQQKIPKGMKLITEDERLETLEFLEETQKQLLHSLSQFGLVVESMTLKKKRAELEKKLEEIESAIEIFSRPKVFVQDSEEDLGDKSFVGAIGSLIVIILYAALVLPSLDDRRRITWPTLETDAKRTPSVAGQKNPAKEVVDKDSSKANTINPPTQPSSTNSMSEVDPAEDDDEEDLGRKEEDGDSEDDDEVVRGVDKGGNDAKLGPPTGRFLLQPTYRRGIGNAVAEYNLGVILAQKYNLTLVHKDLRCARMDPEPCADIFRLSSLNKWSLQTVNESVLAGDIMEIMIPLKRPLLKTSDKFIGDYLNPNPSVKDKNTVRRTNDILFRIPYHSASHSFEQTREFWASAYKAARKTHPIPCSHFSTTDPYKIHIGVHIRHGDVLDYAEQGKERLTKLRFLAMSYFVKTLQLIFNVVPQNHTVINVFSDGKWEDFQELLNTFPESQLILGGDPVKAMHHLAASDIIVGSKSGFTQIAALIGAGGGWGVKILPDVKWPTYAGFDNVVKISEEVWTDSNVKKEKVADIKSALESMARNYDGSSKGCLFVFANAHDASWALLQIDYKVDVHFYHSTIPPLPNRDIFGGPLSSVLYIRLMKGMTSTALEKIVAHLEGLDTIKISKAFVNLHFSSVEQAVKAARWLSSTTNIYTYFHHPHQKNDSAVKLSPEDIVSKTIHVQWLDRDMVDLVGYFFGLNGITLIGFHKQFLFANFKTEEDARKAVERVHRETNMKSRLVEFEYTPHFTPGSLGTPSETVRLEFSTISPSESEITGLFAMQDGFESLHYTPKRCFVKFRSIESAAACVEFFNTKTNLKVVFNASKSDNHEGQCSRGGLTKVAGSGGTRQVHVQQKSPSTAASPNLILSPTYPKLPYGSSGIW
ncbi:Enkurin domain-containing protein 1 [Chytridiales sp. JEL 0842]|nr:Enkurin domain-containing protein 1 [Chytridiales sp. JEL 0842]